MFEYLKRKKRVRQTVKELQRLTDRELSDLGISRWDICDIARKSIL